MASTSIIWYPEVKRCSSNEKAATMPTGRYTIAQTVWGTMRYYTVLFLTISLLAPCILALPTPGAKKFSSNLLASFASDSFTFQAFDLVALRPATRGYALSASVSSANGALPPGVRDAPDIKGLKKSAIAGKNLGLVLRLSAVNLSVFWAVRTCVLPKDGVLRLLALDAGELFLAGTTVASSKSTTPGTVLARYSADGKEQYFRQNHEKVATAISHVVQHSRRKSVFSLIDVTTSNNASPETMVYLDEVSVSDGSVSQTAILTKLKLDDGRITKSEKALAIRTVGADKLAVLLRRKSSNSEGRAYANRYVLCILDAKKVTRPPLSCFSAPAVTGTGDAHIVTSNSHVLFVRLVAIGASERIEVTRLDIASLTPVGWPGALGNQTSLFELPPPESSGARSRTGIAAAVSLAPFGSPRMRLLLTTSGTLSDEGENGASQTTHARMGTLDLLPDGSIGDGVLNTRDAPIRAAALAPLSRKHRIDGLALGVRPSTDRGNKGKLYVVVAGDPAAVAIGGSDKHAGGQTCIGAGSIINGTAIDSLLRTSRGFRLQNHPLRWHLRAREVMMLCREIDSNSTLCATPTHVLLEHGRAVFMRDYCAVHGGCVQRYQIPLNFKARCGTALQVVPGISVSMHAAKHSDISAQAAVDAECRMQLWSRSLWFLMTL